MDEDLRRRYAALVEFTEPANPFFGINSFFALIRPLVDSAAAQAGIKLRPDASYFLLLNLAEMILRPYADDIPTPPVWWARGDPPSFLPKYRDFTPDRTIVRIDEALRIIMDKLPREPTDPHGVSAHQVIKAVDGSWRQLSELFGWG